LTIAWQRKESVMKKIKVRTNVKAGTKA